MSGLPPFRDSGHYVEYYMGQRAQRADDRPPSQGGEDSVGHDSEPSKEAKRLCERAQSPQDRQILRNIALKNRDYNAGLVLKQLAKRSNDPIERAGLRSDLLSIARAMPDGEGTGFIQKLAATSVDPKERKAIREAIMALPVGDRAYALSRLCEDVNDRDEFTALHRATLSLTPGEGALPLLRLVAAAPEVHPDQVAALRQETLNEALDLPRDQGTDVIERLLDFISDDEESERVRRTYERVQAPIAWHSAPLP